MKRLFLFYITFFLLISVVFPFSVSAAKIISYLPAWKGVEWAAEDIDGAKLTHLYISFARINNNFEISDFDQRIKVGDQMLTDLITAEVVSERSWKEIEKLQENYPDLKIIIAVGGWGGRGFSDMAATPATREIFADSVAEYINKHNLDGIDLDWEYPVNGGGAIKARPEDKQNFTELIKVLRTKLGKKKEISFCAGASSWFLDVIEFDRVMPLVDSINIMAYDFNGQWSRNTAHHSNLYLNPNDPSARYGLSANASVNRFLAKGIPADKIILGVAAYGRSFYKTRPGRNGDGLFQRYNGAIWREGAIPFNKIKKYYIGKNGFSRYWDDKDKAAYLYDGTTFISYDDQESISLKAQYVKEKNLAGIMYWNYTNDIEGDLLSAIYTVLSK